MILTNQRRTHELQSNMVTSFTILFSVLTLSLQAMQVLVAESVKTNKNTNTFIRM